MTEPMFELAYYVATAGVIAVGFMGIFVAKKLSERIDTYRQKYGFDRTLESKWFKSDKELDRANARFQKRMLKK